MNCCASTVSQNLAALTDSSISFVDFLRFYTIASSVNKDTFISSFLELSALAHSLGSRHRVEQKRVSRHLAFVLILGEGVRSSPSGAVSAGLLPRCPYLVDELPLPGCWGFCFQTISDVEFLSSAFLIPVQVIA